jgi:hypothetical protein
MELTMNPVKRITDILFSPQRVWYAVYEEQKPRFKVFLTWVVPLALIPAISALIGCWLNDVSIPKTHYTGIGLGIRLAVVLYVMMLCVTYFTAFHVHTESLINDAKWDEDRAFSLTSYAYTPMFLGGVFLLCPPVWWLSLAGVVYSLFLLWKGLRPMMHVPVKKRNGYFVTSLLNAAVFAVLIAFVLVTALFMELVLTRLYSM